MIVIAGALIGAIMGVMAARRNQGKPKDIAQYAAGYAIAFGLIGLIATIVIHRMAV
jgi:hypothetical protein